MNLLRPSLVLGLFTTCVTLTGCADSRSPETGQLSHKPPVELHSCHASPYCPVIKGYGNIEPVRKAEILPPMTETLVRMYRREGDSIRKGDPLAALDTRALELQLSQQESVREGCLATLRLTREKYRAALRDRMARFLSIRSAEGEADKANAELLRMQEVLDHKKELFMADGITKEELQSAQMALMEKQILQDQAQCSLDTLKIGFREEDLLDAGIEIPSDPDELKALYLDLNTRMELAECDLAGAELKEAERQIASLELRIRECTICSPLEGIVGRRYRDEGEKVSPDKALYTIYPVDSLHALISLSEADLLRVRPGMEAGVISDAAALEKPGIVERISPWISTETRSGELRIRFDNTDGLFRAGQFVRVEIALEEESTRMTIPPSALITDAAASGQEAAGDSGASGKKRDTAGSRAAVYLVRGTRIFRKEILTDLPTEEGVPVLLGLEEGDRIVLSPKEGFRDGMEVRVK